MCEGFGVRIVRSLLRLSDQRRRSERRVFVEG
jgi:hypothetical protein